MGLKVTRISTKYCTLGHNVVINVVTGRSVSMLFVPV